MITLCYSITTELLMESALRLTKYQVMCSNFSSHKMFTMSTKKILGTSGTSGISKMFIRKWEDGEVEQLLETPAITQHLFKTFLSITERRHLCSRSFNSNLKNMSLLLMRRMKLGF